MIEQAAEQRSAFTEHLDTAETPTLYPKAEDIRSWTDFSRCHYHPKSVLLCNQYAHNSPDLPFNVSGYGSEAATSRGFYDDFEERLHWLLEECDSIQGLQVLTDTSDAFGGMADSKIEICKLLLTIA